VWSRGTLQKPLFYNGFGTFLGNHKIYTMPQCFAVLLAAGYCCRLLQVVAAGCRLLLPAAGCCCGLLLQTAGCRLLLQAVATD